MPRAKKPRKPVESPRLPKTFDRELLAILRKSRSRAVGLGDWTPEDIVAARDAQVRGHFARPALLARSLMTEPSIFAAIINRLAPHRGLNRDVTAREKLTGAAASIHEEARLNFSTDASVSLRPGLLADDIKRLAIHGVAVDQTWWEPRPDGSRLDPFVSPWPMEAVEWNETDRVLYALTTEGRIPIEHGDGRWIVHEKQVDLPWTEGALVALANLWPDLSFARRDRSKSSQSHGDDKWIGTLPPGVALEDPRAEAMLDAMELLYEFRSVMVLPDGATVKRDQSANQAWQIFKETIDSGSKDAQKILLGQDGSMTNEGGNYVKAWRLFGVRNDIVESDLSTVGTGHSTGLLRPWSLINFGRWDRLTFAWLMPDADEDRRRESIAERTGAFNKAISEYRANGFDITPEFVTELAKTFDVPAPPMKSANEPAPAHASDDSTRALPNVVPHLHPLRAAPRV